MSQNIDREQVLLGLVLNHSSQADLSVCALHRTGERGAVMGGTKLGFSFAESYGIMHGWDHEVWGNSAISAETAGDSERQQADFENGRLIGQRMAKFAKRQWHE